MQVYHIVFLVLTATSGSRSEDYECGVHSVMEALNVGDWLILPIEAKQ